MTNGSHESESSNLSNDDLYSLSETINTATLDGLRTMSDEIDPELADQLLQIFREDTPVRLAAIKEALSGGDTARLRREAHTVRGVLDALGAERLSLIITTIEKAGSIDKLGDPDRLFDRLDFEFDKICRRLEQS